MAKKKLIISIIASVCVVIIGLGVFFGVKEYLDIKIF